jgi:hypothetical protein
VIRLEHAQLADDETARDNIDQNLEKHYQISKSRKDPVNVYSYVYENEGDPAFTVCTSIRVPHTCNGATEASESIIDRISSQDSKITYLDDFLNGIMKAIRMVTSLKMRGTPYGYQGSRSIGVEPCGSITRRTTSGEMGTP